MSKVGCVFPLFMREQALIIVTFSSTRINTAPSPDPIGGINPSDPNAGAMAAMAADAEQRYQKRQKNLKIATELKEKGNIALKEQRYEDADSLYSEGLDLVRDFKVLWTNRAICRMKMKRYEDAISDCDWALRLDEKCPKAITQTGHAYFELGRYEESRKWYQKLRGIGKGALADTYIKRLDVIEKQKSENKANMAKVPEKNRNDFENMINNIKQNDKEVLYYHGGLLLLETTLDKQSIFVPVFNDLDFFNWDHQIIDWWTGSDSSGQSQGQSGDEINEIRACVWRLANISTRNNNVIAESIIGKRNFPSAILHACNGENTQIRAECILTISKWSEFASNQICNAFSGVFVPLIKSMISKTSHFDLLMKIFANFNAANSSFRRQFLDFLPEIISTTIQISKKSKNQNLTSILDSFILLVDSDSGAARGIISKNVEMMNFLTSSVAGPDLILRLKLIHKLTIGPVESKNGLDLIKFCSRLISNQSNSIKLYSVTILGNLARQKSQNFGAEVSKASFTALLDGLRIGDKDFQQVCIRCLAAILEKDHESRKLLIKTDPRLSLIGSILSHDEEDARGNTALVISNCIEIISEDPSDLIKPLISLVDEGKRLSLYNFYRIR